MATSSSSGPTGSSGSRLPYAFLFVAIAVFLGSLIWRFGVSSESASTPSGVAGFTSQDATGAPVPRPAASYVTVASLFGILGFAAGFAIRKALLIVLLVAGFAVIATLALSWFGVVKIDWQGVVDWINATVQGGLKHLPSAEALKLHIPSGASFTTGLVMGVKTPRVAA